MSKEDTEVDFRQSPEYIVAPPERRYVTRIADLNKTKTPGQKTMLHWRMRFVICRVRPPTEAHRPAFWRALLMLTTTSLKSAE